MQSTALNPPTPPASSSSAGGKPDRLYVGNLSPTVDEYTLIQVFQKYGKITKLDFMFHKAGVLKGKPRGYAFIEYSNKDDALKAMVKLHDRLLRGRKLVVTYANSAPPSDLPPLTKGRRPTEAPKTTTLSLLKGQRRPQSAAAQIAAMEAKLASMQKRKPADEDYVPGQGEYGSSGSGAASPMLASGSPRSPMPDADGVMDDEMLGDEAGELAADDLEREIMGELGGGGLSARGVELSRDGSADPGPLGRDASETREMDRSGKERATGIPAVMPDEQEAATASAVNLPPPRLPLPDRVESRHPASLPLVPSLPPRPTGPPAAVVPSAEDRTKAKHHAFVRGLAGLPKKPVI